MEGDAARLKELAAVSAAMARAGSREEAMRCFDVGMRDAFGHILLTLLLFDEPKGVMRRLYSNSPDVSPPGGTKPIEDTPWMDRVLRRGESYHGRTPADLVDVFSDHEALLRVGCGSVINTPVLWLGRTIGSINMLGPEGQYDERDVEWARLYGACATPFFL